MIGQTNGISSSPSRPVVVWSSPLLVAMFKRSAAPVRPARPDGSASVLAVCAALHRGSLDCKSGRGSKSGDDRPIGGDAGSAAVVPLTAVPALLLRVAVAVAVLLAALSKTGFFP